MQKLRKGKYKVTNWQEYNESLKSRGDITFWIEENAIKNWEEDQTSDCTRGRSTKYSDLAIQIMGSVARPLAFLKKGKVLSYTFLFIKS